MDPGQSALEKRISDLERQHARTRECLIEAVSFLAAVLVLNYYNPASIIGQVGMFASAMVATNILIRLIIAEPACRGSISGEWSNCARVLLMWLQYPSAYWPMMLYGALVPGLIFYGFQLARH